MENSSKYSGMHSLHINKSKKEVFFSSFKSGIKKSLDKKVEGLNPGQAKMVELGTEYLDDQDTDDNFFMVQGAGGVGKSYSVKRLISEYNTKSIVGAAPSHSAKNVLQDFLGSSYEVKTISSLLGKLIRYSDSGEEYLINNPRIPRNQTPINNYRIIIVDEGSMVKDSVAEEIIRHVKLNNKKLIVLGDYCQLPPVGQTKDSIFFDNIGAELLQPMRFTGSLYDLGLHIRSEIIKIREGLVPSINIINIKTNRKSILDSKGDGYVFLNNFETLIKAAVRKFKKDNGVNYVRVIAYRNKTINKINNRIRKELYGEDLPRFMPGEQVINSKGYGIVSGKRYKSLITNGELFKIDFVKPIIGPYEIPCLQLYFENKDFDYPIVTPSAEGMVMYQKTLLEIKDKQKHFGDKRAIGDFKNSFAYFDYSYSTSIHKAQGSTISHVFIMEGDILSVSKTTAKEKLQSLYTALSRAAFRAYIFNKNVKPDNSGLTKEKVVLDIDNKK